MIVTCNRCREKVEVVFYYYEQQITSERFRPTDTTEFRATTMAKAICPCCGAEINQRFSSLISSMDIVRLAIMEGGGEG